MEGKYSIIFREMERLAGEPESQFAAQEIQEQEDIRALREITLEMQSPPETYFTST